MASGRVALPGVTMPYLLGPGADVLLGGIVPPSGLRVVPMFVPAVPALRDLLLHFQVAAAPGATLAEIRLSNLATSRVH